jgi:hypothetical protein
MTKTACEKVRISGLLAVLVLSLAASISCATEAWAQERATQVSPSRAESRTPIKIPATDPSTALGSALEACDKAAEGYEPESLPGAKGEIKIDQCYKGRDHLVCSFNAMFGEANYLVQHYQTLINANYSETSNINEVCMKAPDRLASDLQRAVDFLTRFKILKTAYEAHANCAARVQQAVSQVALTDVMTQAPSVVSSMVNTIRADLEPLYAAAANVTEVSHSIDTSYKAILTLQKIHRAMCLRIEGTASTISAPDRDSPSAR